MTMITTDRLDVWFFLIFGNYFLWMSEIGLTLRIDSHIL